MAHDIEEGPGVVTPRAFSTTQTNTTDITPSAPIAPIKLDGRCGECRWHVPTMGHADGCSGPEPYKAPPPMPPCPDGIHPLKWSIYWGMRDGIPPALNQGELGKAFNKIRDEVERKLNPPPTRLALPIDGAGVEQSCRRAIETLAIRLEGIQEGSRNANLAGLSLFAFRLAIRGGISDDEVFERFTVAAGVCGLDAYETRNSLRNAHRDAQAQGPADPPSVDGNVAAAYQLRAPRPPGPRMRRNGGVRHG